MHRDSERKLIDKIKRRDFILSVHAKVRMVERYVVIEDIISVAENLRKIEWQNQHNS